MLDLETSPDFHSGLNLGPEEPQGPSDSRGTVVFHTPWWKMTWLLCSGPYLGFHQTCIQHYSSWNFLELLPQHPKVS